MEAKELSLMDSPQERMVGFQNYLEKSLRDPFVINLEGCSLQEVILACIKAKTRLHPNYRESLGGLIHNITILEEQYRVTLQPVQVTDIFWGYFISFCQGRGLKNSSIGTMCNQLRSILNWAVKYNATVSPTYSDIQLPKKRITEIALSPDDVSRITYFDIDRFYSKKRKDYRRVMTEVMGTAYFGLKPYMDICTNVTISPGVTDYTLPVNYNSIAFVWDSREVSNIYHNGNNGNLPQTKSGFGVYGEHYGVFFLNGGWDSDESILILQVRPQEGMGKVTNFYFSNYYDEWQGHTCYKLTRGHFFVLHPDSITEVDGATFSTSFEDWICDLD